MSPRTIVLVGATSGMGRHAAGQLAGEGHRLILVGRDAGRGRSLVKSLTTRSGAANRPVFVAGDVSTLAGARAVAEQVAAHTDAVDTLVNNAGVMVPDRQLTSEGIELNFAVHHLAPYSMTGLLLPLLRRGQGRIVNTNSAGHAAALFGSGPIDLDFSDLQSERDYRIFIAYSRTKLANLLFTYEFSRRYPDLTMVAVHPGMVRTRLARSLSPQPIIAVLNLLQAPPRRGARPITYLAAAPHVAAGRYYHGRSPATSSAQSMSMVSARRLWDATVQLRGTLEEHAGEQDASRPRPGTGAARDL